MDENNNIFPNGTTSESTGASASNDYIIGGASTPITEPTSAVETTPAPTTSTANIYEQANDAAVNPTANTVTDTPIYTTSTPTGSNSMDSYSAPSSTTYASTGATYSNDTYTNTYNSTGETTESTGLAIASLVCGILSILTGCCCCLNIVFIIPGIICGVLQKPMSDGNKPGMAKAGIITSIVGIVLCIIQILLSIFINGSGFMDSLNSFNY